MKQGGPRVRPKGFTIVETLIVLAVTGALLVSAVILINGKQSKTEFMTGINDLQQQIQQIINQTASGYYPNNGNFKCTASSTAPQQITAGSSKLGTNDQCIFIGNALRFGTTANLTNFSLYPLAANRTVNVGGTVREVQSIGETWPTAIAKATANPNGPTDSSTTYQLENGLSFVGRSATKNAGVATPILITPNVFALAIVSSFASYGGAGGGVLNSGSQQFQLYGFGNSWSSSSSDVDNINNAGPRYVPYDRMDLCFASGGTDQSGQITIGGSGSLAVSVKIFSGIRCGV